MIPTSSGKNNQLWQTTKIVCIVDSLLSAGLFSTHQQLTCILSITNKSFLLGSCDANDAVQLTLVQPGEQKPKTTDIFHPQFTYPIFGDDEQIFGYKGLIIRLRFATHDLRPHIHISYDEKFTAVGDAAAVDLIKTLKEWVPECKFDHTILFLSVRL